MDGFLPSYLTNPLTKQTIPANDQSQCSEWPSKMPREASLVRKPLLADACPSNTLVGLAWLSSLLSESDLFLKRTSALQTYPIQCLLISSNV